ncbi:MAG: glutaredoxin [Leptospiraceae bacterium]|nr:glutaredoxin [Leptospiraceae bacterium]MCB1316366.1 glutaredoxin [Leptospiraceae bacterium]MCB1322475.1 glutaredoxin [Leptospiraceae bacterium]
MNHTKKTLLLCLAVLSVLCLSVSGCVSGGTGSGNSFSADNVVIVYGSHGCGHCRQFVAQLERDSIEYTFYDIYDEPERKAEMFTKARSAFPDLTTVHFPLVDVNGTILMRPGYSEFVAHLKRAETAALRAPML